MRGRGVPRALCPPRRHPAAARASARLARRMVLWGATAAVPAAVVWVVAERTATGEVTVSPVLVVGGEYSDNVDLEPEDEGESAFITRVTPGVRVRAATPRFLGALDGGVTARYATAGDEEGLGFDLNLTGLADVELVRDAFFVEAEGSVSQQVLDNDQVATEANQETVQVYRLSPVLRTRVQGVAVAELRYTLAQVLVGGDDASDATAHVGQATVSSGPDFNRLRWSLNGRVAESLRSDADDVSRRDAIAEAEYAVNRRISAILAGGYQSFDAGDEGEFDSPAWWAGFRLRPGRRTDLEVTYGERDDELGFAADLRVDLSERTRLRASYAEFVSTSQERLFQNVAFVGVDPETGEFIDERLGTRFNPRPDAFDIDDPAERIEAVRAALVAFRGRNAFSLAAGYAQEEQLVGGAGEEVVTVNAAWSRRLRRRTTLDLAANYERTEFDDGQTDDEYLASVGLRHRLTRDVSAFASYIFRLQDSTDEGSEFTENRVLGGFAVGY